MAHIDTFMPLCYFTSVVDLSVIIPMMNEEQNLAELYRRLIHVLESLEISFEILFIDDGSTDNSALIADELVQKDPRVRLLCLSRNFGHQSAICAGLEHSSGKAVLSMDADLQHPTELIPALLTKWREGNNIVISIREDTEEIPIFKKWSSKIFYKIFHILSDVQLSPNAADFRLLDRQAVDTLNRLEERTRFLRGLTSWMGFRVAEVPYRAAKREYGITKYSWNRMVRFAVDGITSFSTKPLYVSAYIGMLVTLSGLIYGFYILYTYLFTNKTVLGWVSTMLVVLILGGVQLISNGLIGIYLSKVYMESKRRPMYIVMRKSGFHEK